MPKQKLEPSTKGTREGMVYVGLWVRDDEKRRWDSYLGGKRGLSEFIRQAVNEKMAKEQEEQDKEVNRQMVKDELKEVEARFAAQFEEVKQLLQTPHAVPSTQPMKNRVLNFLEVLARPVPWEEIVKGTGIDKEPLIVTLEDLFKDGLLKVRPNGDWELAATKKKGEN